jgi:pimeloyl-ACP methyl ester carboxylesterase
MVTVVPVERRVEVGELLSGEGCLVMAADIFLPPRMRSPPVALFCLPGGAVAKGYFSLNPGDFSFAAWMATAGFIVVSLDHLGTGASSIPRDGLELTPDVLAEASAHAVDTIRTDLLAGRVEGQAQPLAELQTIGVGHSMGAMLTAMQQARFRQHAALLLFGFSTQGLAVALTPEEAAFAGNSAGARDNVVRLARTRSSAPNTEFAPSASAQSRELFAGENADRRGVEALRKTRTRLLDTAGLFSMIPGSSAPECAQIDVPVFLAVGDRDMAGPPHQIPANFPASADVTLLVLPATGHCHFLFDSRHRLFARAHGWVEAMLRKHGPWGPQLPGPTTCR